MNAVRQDPAPAVSQGLFKGIAVVIDDGIVHKPKRGVDGIEAILKAIEDAGGHAVKLTELPSRDEEIDNFANAAFFVLDWNLHGSKLDEEAEADEDQGRPDFTVRGLDMGGLTPDHEAENIAFLQKLRERRHAPVFIFTNNDVAEVTDALTTAGLIGEDSGSHIMVKSKLDVGANLYDVLDEWIKQTPSALVLKEWERNQTQAINQLFSEFHDQNKYWPVIFWNGFKEDEVPPGPELGELITRLVSGRMQPLTADLDEFTDKAVEHFGANGERYKRALHQVLQAERLLPAGLLDPGSFSTGDLFYIENNPNNAPAHYYLNVRAACDCIPRGKKPDTNMHLVKGNILGPDKLMQLAQHKLGNFLETDVESLVFALHEGRTIAFKFKSLTVRPFAELAEARVGRMLPPFLTRVTQRYAAFSHRSGLPRVPAALMPAAPLAGPVDNEAANQDRATPGLE